jgi:hypothetical protein
MSDITHSLINWSCADICLILIRSVFIVIIPALILLLVMFHYLVVIVIAIVITGYITPLYYYTASPPLHIESPYHQSKDRGHHTIIRDLPVAQSHAVECYHT